MFRLFQTQISRRFIAGAISWLAAGIGTSQASLGYDWSFGNGGYVTTSTSSVSEAPHDMVIQPDGKIMLVGESTVNGRTNIAMVRYLPNGSLDLSFNGSGMMVSTSLPRLAYGYAATVQNDGKIVVGGFQQEQIGGSSIPSLFRYDVNGLLDTTFNQGNSGGIALAAYTPFSLTKLSDGKILSLGYAAGGSALSRYHIDGTLDTSFGENGSISLGFSAKGLGLSPSGQIVLGGASTGTNTSTVLRVVDGNGGSVFYREYDWGANIPQRPGDEASDIIVQPDGKYVLVGSASSFYDSSSNVSRSVLALSRYLADGTPDPTFGTGGISRISFFPMSTSQGTHVAMTPDGYFVVVGKSALNDSSPSTAKTMVVRMTPDGLIDQTEGQGPVLMNVPGYDSIQVTSMQVDGNGQVLLAATVNNGASNAGSDFALIRMVPEPGSLLLAGLGVAAISLRRNRRRA